MRKYYFVIETLLGLASLVIINQSFFTDRPAFIGVNPHPYWIMILLMASRYGTVAGLFAGATSATLYVFFGADSGLIDLGRFTFPHGAYFMPFLFMLAGAVLGEIRSIYKKTFVKLEKRHQETAKKLENLEVQYEALFESKLELDKRIALQSTTMVSLFERLNQLEKLDPQNLYSQIPGILKELLNAERASVYLIRENSLHLHNRLGAGSNLPEVLELAGGLMGEVVRTSRMVTVRHLAEEQEARRFNHLGLIMSAPIRLKDDSIIGVINVEKIPFFHFNIHTVKTFEVLSQWLSVVVEKALRFKKFQDQNIDDEITGAYSYPYFQKRLMYEIARARRFMTPLSLLLVEIEQFEFMRAADRRNLLVVLKWVFANILREIDLIARYKTDGVLAIILPGQTSSGAEAVANRLTIEIQNYRLRPFHNGEELLTLNFGLSTLLSTEGAYATLIASAEERLQNDGIRGGTGIFGDLRYLLNAALKDGEPLPTGKPL